MKIRVFSVFITLLSLFTFASCDFHNQNVKEYLEHWTNSGQIVGHSFENSYQTNSSGITCLPTDSSQTVTLELHNPQKYNLQFEYIFDDLAVKNAAETLTSPVTIDISDDRFSATAVFSRQFLQKIDDESIGGKNISGHITIFEPDSARTFDPYTIALSANSAPPELKNAVCQLSANGSGTYILCFFAPVLTGTVHANDTTHFYYNGTEFTYAASGSITDTQSPSRFSSTAPDPIFPATSGGFEFSSLSTPLGYIPVYFNTGVAFSSDEQRFTITLKDDYGLTSTANVSSKAQQLNPPTFSVASNTSYAAGEETGTYNVTITAPTQCTDDSSCGTGVTLRYTITAGTAVFEGGTSTTLTGTATGSKTIALPKGTYTVRATASKSYFITSSESSVTGVKITQPAIFYVAETGNDDENTGATASPYRTIQHALDTFSAGVTSGDYESTGVCEVRVKTNLTTPDDFAWTANNNSFVNVSSDFASSTIKIKGYGGNRTIDFTPSGISSQRTAINVAVGTVEIDGISITKLTDNSNAVKALNVSGGNVTYKNSSVHDNKGNVGASIWANGGTLELRNITVENVGSGSGSGGAGALNISGSTTVVNCYDCSFTDVYGVESGAINISAGGSLTMQDCSILRGKSGSKGGGITNMGTLSLKNVSIKDCVTGSAAGWATNKGSGIYHFGSQLTLENVTISGCTFNEDTGSDEPLGAGIYNYAPLNIKGNNQITGNYLSDGTTASNMYLRNGEYINVTGDLTGSRIGVYVPFVTSGTGANAPTASTPKAFTSGYGYGTTNTSLPGAIFTAENGYSITAITSGTDSGEAAFAVSSGGMYLPTDYTFTFTASGASSGSINAVKNTAKTVTITPTVTRTESGSATPTDLYYNSEDKKLYLESDHTVAAGGTNAVTWTAALYNGGVLTTDQPTVNTTGGITVTIPAAAIAYEDTYQLKVIATYMGLAHDTEFTVNVKPPYTFSTEPTAIPAGTTGTAGTSATYVYFGDWPQTIKASDVEIDETKTKVQGAFTYYLGSDGNYYAKCKENAYLWRSDPRNQYSDGTRVKMDNENSYKYFKVEPIKWRVLTTDYNGTGKKLLLAEYALTANIPYYKNSSNRTIGGATVYRNNYKESAVRAYLNGLSYTNGDGTSTSTEFAEKGFLQTAFTSDAQAQIAVTTVINDGDSTADANGYLTKADGTNPDYPTDYTCANTEDKVFLLSQREVTTAEFGFGIYSDTDSASNRVKVATDFAKANKAYPSMWSEIVFTGNCWWLLRSPSYHEGYSVWGVTDNGDSYRGYTPSYPNDVGIDSGGIVPAIVLEN